MREVNKVTRYKMNIQIAFPYINNNQFKNIIQRILYSRNMEVIFEENYKILLKDLKENQDKLRDFAIHGRCKFNSN